MRHASPSTLLITSFALSIGLQKFAYMVFPPGSPRTVEPIPWLTNQFEVKGVLFSRLEILTWIVTILLLVGMVLLLKRTALGVQLRASTEDFRMAQLVGVKANWVISSAFAITGFLAAAVTILYMLNHGDVRPNVGQGPLLIAFVGVVIGGLGSLGGAALGGFTLGVVINILSATLPRSIQGHTLMFAFLLVSYPDARVPAERPHGNRGEAAAQARRAGSAARCGGSSVVSAAYARAEGVLRTIWTPLVLSGPHGGDLARQSRRSSTRSSTTTRPRSTSSAC